MSRLKGLKPNQIGLYWHRIDQQKERWRTMRTYATDVQKKTTHKVAVYLQDDHHKGTVYVKIKGDRLGKDVLEQSFGHLLDGDIYLDEGCNQLLNDDFIEIYKLPRRKKDFVFLIERKKAEDFIVGVKIIDCTH